MTKGGNVFAIQCVTVKTDTDRGMSARRFPFLVKQLYEKVHTDEEYTLTEQ